MKKPILAVLGLAGACAVCCSLPIAMSLFGVLSMAGVGTFFWGSPTAQIVAAGLIALALAVAGIWWSRRRNAVCDSDPTPSSCDASVDSGCGCAPAMNRGTRS